MLGEFFWAPYSDKQSYKKGTLEYFSVHTQNDILAKVRKHMLMCLHEDIYQLIDRYWLLSVHYLPSTCPLGVHYLRTIVEKYHTMGRY